MQFARVADARHTVLNPNHGITKWKLQKNQYREVAALAATYACEDWDGTDEDMQALVKQALDDQGQPAVTPLRVQRLARMAQRLGDQQGWIYPIIAC